jgi:hypothetical protein
VARAGIVALLLAAGAPAASGAPAAERRVVLADPDPELKHAMDQALAPWHLEVVVDGAPPADAAEAGERAGADTARFVVWRDGDQLVAYDRAQASLERRASRAGPLDPPTAAAAALTIKTMMRLPPPQADEPAPPSVSKHLPSIELRIQAGAATRIARSDTTEVSMRLGGAVQLRPSRAAGWWLGVAADGGTSTAVSRASFKGAWSEWSLLALASWSHPLGAVELEPHLGAGLRRSTLHGDEVKTPRSEAATLGTARGGVWVRWRYARWTLAAELAADRTFGPPTYRKTGTTAEIFQVPGLAAELGAVISIDL